MLTLEQVRKHWGFKSTYPVRQLIRSNRLRATKIGGEWRVRRDWIKEYEDKQTNVPINIPL